LEHGAVVRLALAADLLIFLELLEVGFTFRLPGGEFVRLKSPLK